MLRRLLLAAAIFVLPGYSLIYIGEGGSPPNLRWTRNAVVPIHIDTRGYDRLDFATVRVALENGLARWHSADTSLRFGRDPDGRNGDSPAMDGVNLVRFAAEGLPPEVDPNHTLAFTAPLSVACTGVYLEGDITFNAQAFTWSTNPGRDQYDIESVMVHEVGHLLGLDHSRHDDAIMFPSIGPRTVKRQLYWDDVDGLEAVYALNLGGRCGRDGDCANGETCLYSVQSDESFGAFCGPPLGNRRPGAMCVEDAGPCDNGCTSGLCVGSGQCSSVCESDRDCPGGLSCIPQPTGNGEALGLCLDVQLCNGDLRACANGQACGVTAHPTEDGALYLCVPAGDRPVGAECADSSQCVGGVCNQGTCTALCDDDDDCPAAYPCTVESLALGGGNRADVRLCSLDQVPCARPNDCLRGTECGYLRVGGRPQALCLPSEAAAAGAACRSGADCRSNLCLDDGRCSDVCFQDRDCPNGWTCDRAPFEGTPVPACVPGDLPVDAGPPAPDASPRDAGVAPDAAAPQPDQGPADAGVAIPEAGPVPDQGGPVVVVGDDEGGRRGGGSAPGPFGCDQSGDAPSALWLLPLLALGLRRRR